MFGIGAFPEHLHYLRTMSTERPDEAAATFAPPICSACRRERTLGADGHPMDAYDYSPLQVLTGQPLGWYSGDDGEICPEDMEKSLRGGGL